MSEPSQTCSYGARFLAAACAVALAACGVAPSTSHEPLDHVTEVRTSAGTVSPGDGTGTATAESIVPLPEGASALVASDEFDGDEGSLPDRSVWRALEGGNGWGNDELQSYTSRSQNASLDGRGHLRIVARKERYTGGDGITRDYTSARLVSVAGFTYGRLEARIRVPVGQGLWPAFWTVGQDIYEVGWPRSGEIDVMEAVNEMTVVSGSLHAADAAADADGRWTNSASTRPKGGVGNSWHVYAIEWRKGSVEWFLDGRRFARMTDASVAAGEDWPFDKAHLVQLNLAVGGEMPGAPSPSTEFPAVMLVDYVRVFSLSG